MPVSSPVSHAKAPDLVIIPSSFLKVWDINWDTDKFQKTSLEGRVLYFSNVQYAPSQISIIIIIIAKVHFLLGNYNDLIPV